MSNEPTEKHSPTPGPDVAPRMEKLLDDGVMSHQQKDKIKIAFAEGYLAGMCICYVNSRMSFNLLR